MEPYRVYLVGEYHGSAYTYDVELELVRYLYTEQGVRDIFLEMGYSDAMFVREYLDSENETHIVGLLDNMQDAMARNKEYIKFFQGLRAFYRSLPEEDRFRIHGVDVQLQYTVGMMYLSRLWELYDDMSKDFKMTLVSLIDLKEVWGTDAYAMREQQLNKLKAMLQVGAVREALEEGQLEMYLQTIKSMIQGNTYMWKENDAYREQCISDAFLRALDSIEGKPMGIWGSAHTGLDGWPDSFGWTHQNTAQNIAERIGTAEGGVTAVHMVYHKSFGYMGGGNTYSPDSDEGRILSNRSNSIAAFFALDPQDKEASLQNLARHSPFVVSITGSPAATPYHTFDGLP